MSQPASRIFITGVGLITPLGRSAWETFRALLDGKTISMRTRELPNDCSEVDLIRATGGVDIAQHTLVDPAIALAEHAAREAMTMANLPAHTKLPCIIGTSKGAVHALTHAANACTNEPGGAGEAARATLGIAIHPTARDVLQHAAGAVGPHEVMTHALRKRLALGDTTHVVAACASSLAALHRARRELLDDASQFFTDEPSPRRMLVVTADAALLPMFIHAYRRLGVLPTLNTTEYAGLPLDERRNGFMLAEAGAAVVLERRDGDSDDNRGIDSSPPRGTIELLDTAEACDACDMIRPNADMSALRQVARKLMSGRAVTCVHPHTPGTKEQDATEMAVYRELANETLNRDEPESTQDIYAAKGAIGHSLGAAGLSSLIIACLSARAKRRPPMPWLEAPIEGVTRAPKTTNEGAQAVFAAGFGGHVAGAVVAAR